MSDLLEIVELSNGEVVLRRADDGDDALVSIRFSEEAMYFLKKNPFHIAKAMIEAGLESVNDMDADDDLGNDLENDLYQEDQGTPILH